MTDINPTDGSGWDEPDYDPPWTPHDFSPYTNQMVAVDENCACPPCAAEREQERKRETDAAVSALMALVASDRSAHPNTSADPYRTALVLWTAAVPRVREVLANTSIPTSALRDVEDVYRETLTMWVRGDEPDPDTDRFLADDLRDALEVD